MALSEGSFSLEVKLSSEPASEEGFSDLLSFEGDLFPFFALTLRASSMEQSNCYCKSKKI